MHLAFRLSDRPLRLFDGAGDPLGRVLGHAIAGGARSAYYIRDVAAPSCSVGAMLRPGAAALLFGLPAGELSERHTRLDDLWGRSANVAHEQLLEAGAPEKRFGILESLLASRLPVVRGLHPAVAYAIERFQLLDSVRDVAKHSGYSHRHFISLFREAVGLAPKRYCRVLRFQAALRRAARNGTASWAAIALDAGYSDQAHFNRDFLEFAGVTPTAYRKIDPASPSHVALPWAGHVGS